MPETNDTPESRDLSRMPLSRSRVRVVELLQAHYAHGNLEMDELESRLDLANRAESVEDLVPLIRDLPAIFVDAEAPAEGPVAINRGEVRESKTYVAVLSGTGRKGAWRPARRTNIVTFMGGLDLDFREALMPPGTSEVNIFCLMGGVDIKVPPGLKVENRGFAIMGGFEDNTDEPAEGPGPKLVVRGFALMGGVDVKVKERKRPRR
jgi:hypothetical protein